MTRCSIGAERCRHAGRRREFRRVALAVGEADGVAVAALRPGRSRGRCAESSPPETSTTAATAGRAAAGRCVGCAHRPGSLPHRTLCSWTCRRTSSRSARIHSARSRRLDLSPARREQHLAAAAPHGRATGRVPTRSRRASRSTILSWSCGVQHVEVGEAVAAPPRRTPVSSGPRRGSRAGRPARRPSPRWSRARRRTRRRTVRRAIRGRPSGRAARRPVTQTWRTPLARRHLEQLRHGPPLATVERVLRCRSSTQRSGQPVSRMNSVGQPTLSASPWIETKVSVSLRRLTASRRPSSPAARPRGGPPRCRGSRSPPCRAWRGRS